MVDRREDAEGDYIESLAYPELPAEAPIEAVLTAAKERVELAQAANAGIQKLQVLLAPRLVEKLCEAGLPARMPLAQDRRPACEIFIDSLDRRTFPEVRRIFDQTLANYGLRGFLAQSQITSIGQSYAISIDASRTWR